MKAARGVDFKSSHYKKEKNFVTMCSDECQLDLLWWLFHNTHEYQIIMLYTWNLYNVTYQLYL